MFTEQKGSWRRLGADCDIVLNALMGIRGLVPTYHAIRAGHDIALANKETLVAGGHIIMNAVEKGRRRCFRWTASTAPFTSACRETGTRRSEGSC